MGLMAEHVPARPCNHFKVVLRNILAQQAVAEGHAVAGDEPVVPVNDDERVVVAARRLRVLCFETDEALDKVESEHDDPRRIPAAPPPLPPPAELDDPVLVERGDHPEANLALVGYVGNGGWGAIAKRDPDDDGGHAGAAVHADAADEVDHERLVAVVASARVPSLGDILVRFTSEICVFAGDVLSKDKEADEVFTKLATDRPLMSLGSSRLMADDLNSSRWKVVRHWAMMAAVSWLLWLAMMRNNIRTMIRVFRDAGGQFVCLFRGRRADETPQKLSVFAKDTVLSVPDVATATDADVAQWKRCMMQSVKDTEPVKIFNTEYTISVLFRLVTLFLCSRGGPRRRINVSSERQHRVTLELMRCLSGCWA